MLVPCAGKENIGASWEAGDGGFCVEPVELKCCQDNPGKVPKEADPVIQNTGSRAGQTWAYRRPLRPGSG